MGAELGAGIDVNAPAVVAAFHRTLGREALIALVAVALAPVAWRVWAWRAPAAGAHGDTPRAQPEPRGRRALRLAFGGLWVLDGLLQLQRSMPLGLVPKVIEPAAASSPAWVQRLVADLTGPWSRHPVTAAAAAVWIQLGIGGWLLVANRGLASRLAGLASVAWATVVWSAGNAFGGLFGSGLSWLTGAPGAVLVYLVAGVLVALPEGRWEGPRLGRMVLRGVGACVLGFAVLQAWPGRGFWQGGGSGGLSSAVTAMAATPQPGWLRAAVSGFASLATSHGWAVNLGAVLAMAVAALGLLLAPPGRALSAAVAATVTLCVADWVLVQDLGFLGGLGTDPNSMLPTAALVLAAWISTTRRPADLPAGVAAAPAAGSPRRQATTPGAALRIAGAGAALVVVLIGAVPMAAAATQPQAATTSTAAAGWSAGGAAPQPASSSRPRRTQASATARSAVGSPLSDEARRAAPHGTSQYDASPGRSEPHGPT